MACQSFLESSNVELFYCLDPGLTDIPVDQTWEKVYFNSESFSSNPNKSTLPTLRNSPAAQAMSLESFELSASLDQEFEINWFFLNVFSALLGSNTIKFPHTELTDFSGQGYTADRRFAFLKVIDKGDTRDYLLFRDCVPTSLSLSVSSGSLAQCSYSFTPGSIGNPSQSAPNYLDVDPLDLPAKIASYVLKQGTPINPQSSKTFSNLTILSSRLYEGVAFTITLDISREVKSNSLLGSKPYQYQVHTKSLDVSLSGEYYFSSAQLHSELHEDEQYQISFTLSNDTNEELLVTLPVTEVAELSDPLSSGESDLLFSARFSALQPVESNLIAEFSLSV